MRVLHSRIFPVYDPNFLVPLFIADDQKIIRHCINMRQYLALCIFLDNRTQGKNIFLCLRIILIKGSFLSPKALIKFNLFPNIKLMRNGNFKFVKFPQLFHTISYIAFRTGITNSRLFYILRDLISVFFVYINNLIADMTVFYLFIYFRFFPAVN